MTVTRKAVPGGPPSRPPLSIMTLPSGGSVLPPVPGAGGAAISLSAETNALADSSLSTQPAGSAVVNGPGFGSTVVVTGPLPIQSAGFNGGWFAEAGETSPPIDPLDAALVDLKLLEILPKREQAAKRVGLPTDSATEPAHAPAPLVALEGAGGFPLLAAALSASIQGPQRGVSSAFFPEIATESGAVILTDANTGLPVSHAAAGLDPVAEELAGEAGAERPKRRSSLLVSLNVVATL